MEQFKRAKAVILPSNNQHILKTFQLWTHNNGGNTSLAQWRLSDEKVTEDQLKGYCIPQHLYIISDDEIKELP